LESLRYTRQVNSHISLMRIKTITLPEQYSFQEALSQLLAGTCLGIRPGKNTNYVTLFKPHWMNQESPDWMLQWAGESDIAGIRSNQYLEPWHLVILDHRQLPALLSQAPAAG
jgi:hypothetical protein